MFDKWSQIEKLLLLYTAGGQAPAPDSLQPAVEHIRQALPQAQLTLWTLEPHLQAARQLDGLDQVLGGPAAWLAAPEPLIAQIRALAPEASLIFSPPGISPYTPAYICYLAGVPVRIGQSLEFGGRVLSQRIVPAFPTLPPAAHHLHLVEAAGLTRRQASLDPG